MAALLNRPILHHSRASSGLMPLVALLSGLFAVMSGCSSTDAVEVVANPAGHVGEPTPPFLAVTPTGKTVTYDLVAQPAAIQVAHSGAKTQAWTFNGQTPGPTLRATVGDTVVINFKNELPEPTTIHWHGLRIRNAMDGVPVVMKPIQPGASFRYEFVVPDAGSFWYHPHMNTAHQVERGLYGAFVVDETTKPTFHADDYWVIDDWHLDAQNQHVTASVSDDFWGRRGPLITLNTSTDLKVAVAAKQVRRVRLLNGSNSSIFVFKIAGHKLTLIAKDGVPVMTPWTVDSLRIAPGERWDIALQTDQLSGSFAIDVQQQNNRFGQAGGTVGASTQWTVNSKSYPDVDWLRLTKNKLTIINVQNDTPMSHPFHMHGHFFAVMSRTSGMNPPAAGSDGQLTTVGHLIYGADVATDLAAPTLETPLFPRSAPASSDTISVVLGGGMGGMGGGGGGMGGGGGSNVLTTADRRAWHDTVEVRPGQTMQLAIFGNNPGDWMYHCHILEHEEAGMMGVFQVAQ